MATTKANLLQTAYNVAATIVSAELQSGVLEESVTDRLAALKAEVFKDLTAVDDANPQPKQASGGNRSSNKVGGNSGGKALDGDEAGRMVIKGGKFADLTIKQVFGLSADDADEYGYDKSGRKYIEWMASDNNNNDYSRRRAAAFIESVRAGGDE